MAKPQRMYSSQPTVDRAEGTIIKFIPDKGFGFIRTPDGKEIFFHRTSVRGNVPAEEIRLTQPVRFILTDSPKGPRAEDVELI